MSEKSATAISPQARSLYQRGSEAINHNNLDYAITLLTQMLETEPGFFEGRRALHAARQKRTAAAGAGFFKKVFSGASVQPLVAKAQLEARRNPAEAMKVAEHILNNDPNNGSAIRILAEAAQTLEMPRTAAMAFSVAVAQSPKDRDLVMKFAEALVAIGDTSKAEQAMTELARQHPGDPDVFQALKNVMASKTLHEGGYNDLADGKGSYRDVLRNETEAVALEQEQKIVKSDDIAERLIEEYETRLKTTDQGNVKLLRSLAELYAQKKFFELALSTYEKIRAGGASNDGSLERAIADTIVKRFDFQVQQLDATAPDHAEQVAKLQAEKLAFQMDEGRKRVERWPTDLALRFELGVLCFNAGKISEAIQEFQKAQNNPHKRVASLGYLAQCFAHRKMWDLAARTLQNAIKEKPVFDEEKKDLIYQLGCVLENTGKKEEAVDQFKLIYETDIGYRDVAAKVDAYYAGK